jgi:hypothetical protein
MKILLGLVLIASAAQAQNYDVDITINQYTFAGSFVNNGGTLSAVNVADGFDQGAFTGGQLSNGTVVLTDYEGAQPGNAGSEVYQLLFTPNFAQETLSNIAFQESMQWGFNCGVANQNSGQTPVCTSSIVDPPAHAAPEMDPGTAVTALALLAGLLTIARQRRKAPLPMRPA